MDGLLAHVFIIYIYFFKGSNTNSKALGESDYGRRISLQSNSVTVPNAAVISKQLGNMNHLLSGSLQNLFALHSQWFG